MCEVHPGQTQSNSDSKSWKIEWFDPMKWKQMKVWYFVRSNISEDVFWNFLNYYFYISSCHLTVSPGRESFNTLSKSDTL